MLIGLILFLFSFGCSSGSEGGSSPVFGDLLIQGSIGDASNLIPMLATNSASQEIGGLTPLQFKRQTDTYKMDRDFRKYKYLAFAYTYWGII